MSLEKKLKQAYVEGIKDGQDFIFEALRQTHGIGPTLEKRIMEKAKELAHKKIQG